MHYSQEQANKNAPTDSDYAALMMLLKFDSAWFDCCW